MKILTDHPTRVAKRCDRDWRAPTAFPNRNSDAFTDQIAKFHSVRREQIILGCGSTEILRMCSGAFLVLGKKLAMATPGFEAMAQYARLQADEHVRTCAQRNADTRQEYFNQANARMLRWIDSHTKFVLLNTGRPW